jgi:hypothetical protein
MIAYLSEPPDANGQELLDWRVSRLSALEQTETEMQRADVQDGVVESAEADGLPAWEREGRAPEGMDEEGRPDPMTAEGVEYMARQLDAMEGQ